MKSLYAADGAYTPAATELDAEIHRAIKPILDRYYEEDYNYREISHEAMKAVLDWELIKAIQR